MSYNGTIVNVDPNLPMFFMQRLDLNDTNLKIAEKAEEYISMYLNKGITDVAFCVFEQNSITESRVFSSRADKYFATIENNVPVNYSEDKNVKYLKWLKDNNLDLFKVWIEYLRKNDINPWLSFRMNDAHFHGEETSFIRSEFFYEAKEKGWLLGEVESDDPYFAECFDYSVPEVRKKMLDYIAEQLQIYDVYGIELDFVREIACLNYKKNPNCHLLMNEFMEDVKKITKSAEIKFGHPIKIMVRLTRDIEESKLYGFDAVYWAEKKLVDIIVPTSRWATTDSNMPIDNWVKALSCYGVEVCAGLELNLNYWDGLINNVETVKGFTVAYASLGCEKGYLYNYFSPDSSVFMKNENPLKTLEEIWNVNSSLENARKGTRRHILTCQDDADGFALKEQWKLLPLKVTDKACFEILTGEILENEKARLIIGYDGRDIVSIVNGEEVSFSKDDFSAYIYRSEKNNCENLIVADFIGDGVSKRQIIDVFANEEITIKYLEIIIEA